MAVRQWKRGNRVEDFLTRDARGLAIIITNDYHGTDTLSNLDGTTADGDKMVEAFGKFFGFDCVRGKNLVSGDIKELVKSVSECSSLVNHGCLAFIFSGHGGEGVIFGEDQNFGDAYVDILEDIVQPFDPQNSPSIANVPKLFFIDACRGDESVRGAGGKGKWVGEGSLKEAATKSSTTLLGNYILGYATMPGFKSYLRGDNAKGSVWMPLLADELQYEPSRDVLNVLQDVNGRLMRDYENERIKTFQQPHFESTCANPVNLFLISGLKQSKAVVRPTMPELINLETKGGKKIQVINEITSFDDNTCRDFAIMLLKDRTTVRKLKNKSSNSGGFIRDVLGNWLGRDDDNRDDPAFPRTWLALAHCVETCGEDELGELAKALRDYCKQ